MILLVIFSKHTFYFFLQIFSAHFLKWRRTWNHPKATWDHLKPAILRKLRYSQLAFLLILHLLKCVLRKFNPKNWSSSNWLKFGTEVDCYMLISIFMLIFSKFLSFIFSGQIWCKSLKFPTFSEFRSALK